MTYEEALDLLENGDWFQAVYNNLPEDAANKVADAINKVASAIRFASVGKKCDQNATGIKPDCNQPLTLDKVWKMKGRPVVVKYIYGGPDTIGIVDVRFVPHLGADKIRVVFANGYITVNEKDYGHYYNLYDYNPAHIDREAWDDCPVCGKYKEISFRGFRTKEEAMNLSGKVYPHITGGAMFCPKCGKPRNERAWADLEQRLRG